MNLYLRQGDSYESVGGCPPNWAPATQGAGTNRTRSPRLAVGGQWGRSPHKNQNPSRAGRGRGGPPPPAPPVSVSATSMLNTASERLLAGGAVRAGGGGRPPRQVRAPRPLRPRPVVVARLLPPEELVHDEPRHRGADA